MFLINGIKSDSITAQNRGLHYGDGVFETIAVQNGKPLCWDAHYQRLLTGCNRLGIKCPAIDLLKSEILQLPVTESRCVVKIIVTRGSGGRGYRPPGPESAPDRIIGLYPWPDYPGRNATDGIKARICTTRLSGNTLLAGIKHLNRLEQVLACREWDDPDIAEGLMLDQHGNVIEGTMSNLFFIKDHVLITPDLSVCGIAGIVRGNILDLSAQLNMQVNIRAITEPELYTADELFLCNSVIGVWPVRSIEQRPCTVGPHTRNIRDLLIRNEIIAA